MRHLSIVFITLLAAVLGAAAGSGDPDHQSVGLVLSGGGAKGIAHIGVIQALEDNDIPIDYVAGTSMGAIVGGLYAAGYTTEEMLEMLLSDGFRYWSTGRVDPALTFYFNREEPSPTMFTVPLSAKGGGADSVPQSIISGLPMSFAFMDLFAAYTAQCGGDFDRLFVPYRCVASNVDAKHKRVFRGGSLGDAIRASMTFPIIFQPIAIDDTLYYDGGIYDNFPVGVMRDEFAPSIMIGVNVGSSDKGPQTSLMDQLDKLVIQGHVEPLPDDEGIYMRIDLDRFSLLDFPRAREIYRIGYDHAMSMMDSIKARIHTRTAAGVRTLRRDIFKSQSPYVRFDRVNVTGGSQRQNEYIRYLFHPTADSDTIGIGRARDAFYRAISSGKISNLYPQAVYNDTSGLFTLDLKAAVKGRFKGSVGGYITSSTSSYLYFSAGYSSLSFSSLDASVSGWIGQTTMAGRLDGRIYLHTPLPSAIAMQAVVSRSKFYENDHVFYSDKYPTFLLSHEYFGRVLWSMAAGRSGKIDIGAGYGSVRDSYYRDNTLEGYSLGRLRSRSRLWQAIARYSSSTLDEVSFPRSGRQMALTVMGLTGTTRTDITNVPSDIAVTHPKWVQAEFSGRFFPALSKSFALGIETDVMLSTRKLLPTYSATIASAPAFCPTPSSNNAFRASFRANSFVSVGLTPVYNINSNLSARVGGYCFVPIREIEETADRTARYGRWIGRPEAFCEAAVAYHFPFGTLAGYVNYATAEGSKWNVGLSFGIFMLPPKFLR